MKNARTAALAILTAALAVPALADTATGPVTRDQVKAEYHRALQAGELDYGREFVTPANARHTVAASASAKIEDLAPTAAGSTDGAKSAAVSSAKTVN